MRKGITPTTAIKVKGIADYVRNRNILIDTPCVISSSGLFYFFEGKAIPESDFKDMFPLILAPINYKGENPDHTKIK